MLTVDAGRPQRIWISAMKSICAKPQTAVISRITHGRRSLTAKAGCCFAFKAGTSVCRHPSRGAGNKKSFVND